MCETFPRIASCDYHRFGTGGKPEKINSLCILALNIINDKVRLTVVSTRDNTAHEIFYIFSKSKCFFASCRLRKNIYSCTYWEKNKIFKNKINFLPPEVSIDALLLEFLKQQSYFFVQGGIHKIHLQEEGVRWSKNLTFL